MTFDYHRPLLPQGKMGRFVARDKETATRYGRVVLAAEMSNAQYAERHQHLAEANNMRPPPSHHRIFSGYVVVRRIGHSDRYETWMPEHVFAEIYVPEATAQ